MSYTSIVALIDAELARLLSARAYLTAPTLPGKRAYRKQKPEQPVSASAAEELPEGALPTAPSLESSPQREIVRVPAKRTRRPAMARKPQAMKLARALEPGALNGSVPRGPVFVPGQSVREEKARRQQVLEPGFGSPGTGASPQLTAELLSQRWLRSSDTSRA